MEKREGKHEERLMQHALIKADKIQRKRIELNNEMLKDCQNFKPKINKKSELIN